MDCRIWVYEKSWFFRANNLAAILAAAAEMTVPKHMLVILGATASGKSSLAVALALPVRGGNFERGFDAGLSGDGYWDGQAIVGGAA